MQPGQRLPRVGLLLLVLRGPRQHLLGHQGQRDRVHLQDNVIINSDITNNKVHVVLPGLHTQKQYPDTKTKTEGWEGALHLCIYYFTVLIKFPAQSVGTGGTGSAMETVSGRIGRDGDIALKKVDNNLQNTCFAVIIQ